MEKDNAVTEPSAYSAKAIESEVLAYWEANGIPEKLKTLRKGAKPFFLLDGPPYINALPHVGHVKSTAYKDIWSRYYHMLGFDSKVQAGFDTHGLPVEVIVEKELGITSKQQIMQMGIEKFDQACLAKVLNNEAAWLDYYRKLGALRAYSKPYFTYSPQYIQSAWWTFSELHKKGLVREGELSIHWCPHCETSLSGYEVSDSYAQVSDPSIYVKFPIAGAKDEYLLVWTTTPWTLPANVAVAVNPRETYVKVKVQTESGEQFLWMAEKRLEQVAIDTKMAGYSVVQKALGSELEGLKYLPVIQCQAQKELDSHPNARKVYLSIQILKNKKYKKHVKSEESGPSQIACTLECTDCQNRQDANLDKDKAAAVRPGGKVEGFTCLECGSKSLKLVGTKAAEQGGQEEFEEFVTMAEGSGLVHAAPGHGQTDNLFGKRMGLPSLSPVDEGGKFTKDVEEWQGKLVKEADTEIITYLKTKGFLHAVKRIKHKYPLCWRCKSPLIFRLSPQLYLEVEPIKGKMMSENSKVKWMPPYGEEAMGNWIAGASDWCVSQQRFWGIPIPLWKCQGCGAQKVVASIKELRENATADPGELSDLHRHTVDSVEFQCKDCKGVMRRIPDIFTVWFDSSVAAWASMGYPYSNKEEFERFFPVDLVDESQDQIRGWFYVQLFTGVGVFGHSPYKSVAMNGWVVDDKGAKMSKSVRNVVWANDAIEKAGSDALRLYFCKETSPWDVQRFSFASAQEISRTLNIFWNSYQFYRTYCLQATAEEDLARPDPQAQEDKWIISRLNSMELSLNSHMREFEFDKAGRLLLAFLTDDLSRQYIKRIRDRVGVEAEEKGKREASRTLGFVLVECCKLLAPFAPFLSDYAYLRLSGNGATSGQSVHFTNYPVGDHTQIDAELEGMVSAASDVIEAAGALRQEAKVKLRWPLAELAVFGANASTLLGGMQASLSSQANVVKVSLHPEGQCPSGPQWLSKQVVVERKGAKEQLTVCLNVKLDEGLLQAALVRELTRAIQAARKEAGLSVNDRIAATVWSPQEKTRELLGKRLAEIGKEVTAAISVVDSEEKLSGQWAAQASAEGLSAFAKLELTHHNP